MKEYNKAATAQGGASGGGSGSKKLVEILLRLTTTEDDPLLGKVLRLKPLDIDTSYASASAGV